MAQGFIKTHRQITSHWLWADKPFSCGQAWIDLLIMASHSDNKKYRYGKVVESKRGQVFASYRFLAERWGWDKNRVSRFLKTLRDDEMIKVVKSGTQGGTVNGTVCRALNGKVFEITERQPGVNFPPMHPWCRCTWLPYVEDWDKWMDEYEKRHGNSAQKEEAIKSNLANDKLTDEDIGAINRYISADSYIINSKLRNGVDLSEEEKEWARNLDNAIMKLPEYKGIVYRSLDSRMIPDLELFFKRHTPGEYIVYPSFTSSATSVYDKDMDIQFIIESNHGADIRKYNENEQEILFSRNSVFKINKREGNTIWLKEI